MNILDNMRLVVIESPYAGKSRWAAVRWLQRRRNIRYAREAMRDSLALGEAPIASHLLYTQKGILDDDIPLERTAGIEAGFAWRKKADAVVFYVDLGMSPGMTAAMERAIDQRLPVETRRIR